MSTDNTNAAVAADTATPEVVRPKISDYRRHLLICTGPRCTQNGEAQDLFDSLGAGVPLRQAAQRTHQRQARCQG